MLRCRLFGHKPNMKVTLGANVVIASVRCYCGRCGLTLFERKAL